MKDRSTGDLLVILLALTVCVTIIVGEVGILVLEGIDSAIDTSVAGGTIGQIINTLVGLVAGYLAGRTETGRVRRSERREEDTPP